MTFRVGIWRAGRKTWTFEGIQLLNFMKLGSIQENIMGTFTNSIFDNKASSKISFLKQHLQKVNSEFLKKYLWTLFFL